MTIKTHAVFSLLVLLLPLSTHAAFLSPGDFVSNGDFISVAGTYSLDTDSLTLSGPQGYQVAGVVNNGIAVFTFDIFSLGSGANLTTTGTLPSAILSHTAINLGGNGVEVLSGGGQGGEPRVRGEGPGGGFPGFNFFGGAGGGGGFGGNGGRGQFDNPTFSFPGGGGPVYGDLEDTLQGGSGGGGGKTNTSFQSAGGDGGGGLELGALVSITVSSSLVADGQPGQPRGNNHTGGGGGSGGGLILHAPSIANYGIISANGGRGGDGVFENGGGGGGGRILIDTIPGRFTNLGGISVSGGTAPSDFFGAGLPGQPGVISVRSTIVPEPTTLHGICCLVALAPVLRYRNRVVAKEICAS